MKRSRILKCLIVPVVCWLAIYLAPVTQAEDKPNTVIILADDLGNADLGYRGSKIRTPNIDALAKEGVRLESFYGMHLCSPARVEVFRGAVRKGRWKLVKLATPPGKTELFDLQVDPGEETNVAEDFPDVVRDPESRLIVYASEQKTSEWLKAQQSFLSAQGKTAFDPGFDVMTVDSHKKNRCCRKSDWVDNTCHSRTNGDCMIRLMEERYRLPEMRVIDWPGAFG